MSGLKFTLSIVTLFLPGHISGLKKIIFRPETITWACGNEQMLMMFATEEFLEVAIESCSEWDLNPQPLNSAHMINLTYQAIIYIYIYINYIYIYIYIYIHHVDIHILLTPDKEQKGIWKCSNCWFLERKEY